MENRTKQPLEELPIAAKERHRLTRLIRARGEPATVVEKTEKAAAQAIVNDPN